MGGAVSSGRDNGELVDNLMGGNYIRTQAVERVFRALDRADYMSPESREQAYKDLAWRNGLLHMSAPCIYSEVMEGLQLRPGLTFLNIGSGTGYLSTLVGLILGSSGISHGVEVHQSVVEYSTTKLSQFLENSPTLDEFDYCEPKFYCGNGLCLAPLQAPYDRVYCGAGCPEQYQNYFKQLVKVGGVLVMPLNDSLLQVVRTGAAEWRARSLLNVSFASLREPPRGAPAPAELLRLDELTPPRLQVLSRGVVRNTMRAAILSRNPALRAPPRVSAAARRAPPRRICIPLDNDSDENLNALHDLDAATGANEMNALLSLVLSMGHNRAAGALRFDPLDSPRSGDSGGEGSGQDGDDDPDEGPGAGPGARPGAGPGARPGAGPGAGPGARPGAGPGARPGAGPGARPGAGPGAWLGAGGAPLPFGNIRRPPQEGADDGRAAPGARPPARNVIMVEFRDGPSSSGSGDCSRAKRSKKQADATKIVCDAEKVAPEVEIYLGDREPEAQEAVAGTSSAAWGNVPEAKREHSSDEETTESTSKGKEEKRQKFDSGLGEENSPSSSSSPDKSEPSGSERGARPSCSSLTDEGVGEELLGRRRLHKRALGQAEQQSSSSTEADDEADWSQTQRRRGGDGTDARRVRLSILMKRGVKELPLPYALKKYVNMGRCFEF